MGNCCSLIRRVWTDFQQACCDPPESAIEREVLFSRIKAYSVRVQFICWNTAAVVLLYMFPDSLLNQYIYNDTTYLNVIFHSIQMLSIIAYFITSLVDPGFIPKINDLNLNKNSHNININPNNNEFISLKNTKILINTENPPSSFCWRCKFIRPLRAKHCYDCDRCVAKFDHHCPMVGNCVGGKNHRFFVLFMTSETIVVIWTFYMSLNTLFKMDLLFNSTTESEKNIPNSIPQQSTIFEQETHERTTVGWLFRIIFFIAMFFALFVVVGLTGFHLYLAGTNQTTYEMIKPDVIEKYFHDERKRARELYKARNKKNNNNNNDEKLEIIMKDDDTSESDTDNSDDDDDNKNIVKQRAGTPYAHINDSKNRYKQKLEEGKSYFDEGFCSNMWIFFRGEIKPKWLYPLPCVLMEPSDSDNN